MDIQFENEKEVLEFKIREEERNAEQNKLDEGEIRAAFRQAQQMFRSGELPQIEQILNLYPDRVIVYPEYVEIHINNVPNNMLKRNQETKEPAFSGLHAFTITRVESKENKNKRSKGISGNQEKATVILHIKLDTKHQPERNGQKETRAQDSLDSSNSGGAEPLSILLGHSYIGNPSDNYEDLLIGETYTNLRKLPLCQCEVRNPLSMMLIIGKDSLQGPRNGR